MADPALGVRRPLFAARVSGEVVRGLKVSKNVEGLACVSDPALKIEEIVALLG
jgi:hypothetical protein